MAKQAKTEKYTPIGKIIYDYMERLDIKQTKLGVLAFDLKSEGGNPAQGKIKNLLVNKNPRFYDLVRIARVLKINFSLFLEEANNLKPQEENDLGGTSGDVIRNLLDQVRDLKAEIKKLRGDPMEEKEEGLGAVGR